VQDYRPEFRGVASRRRGSGSQRVVSLELHHRPDRDPRRHQGTFEESELRLRQQVGRSPSPVW